MLFLVLLLSSVYLNSCGEDDRVVIRICTEYPVARVDTVIAPDTVNVNDTLRIRLKGYLGPNSCYHFYQFEPNLVNNSLDLTVRIIHYLCTFCLQALAGFDSTYFETRHVPGEFYIRIKQPYGDFLTDSVYVR